MFSWTPTEAPGPGTFDVTVRVTDDGSPALTDTETITITVNEVNEAPVLAAIGDRVVNEGNELSFTATATDPDVPANGLTFSLDAGAPAGATIDPASGLFTWTPNEAQGPGTFDVTVRVTDDGTPALEDFETIMVTVNVVNEGLSVLELSDIENGNGNLGFVLNGVSAFDLSGYSVSSAGDVNGDGFDDLIVGARGDDPNGAYSGASFVIFGSATDITGGDGVLDLVDIETGDGSLGFVLNGVSASDSSGRSVSLAGDINGDGLGDLIVGADGDDPNGSNSGASFVVFGSAADITGGDGMFELSDIETGDGSLGFVLRGVSAGDYSGRSVSSAGDVNGDGFDDLLVGATGDAGGAGASFVVFGSGTDITGGDGVFELSDIETGDDSLGFILNGVAAYDNSGISVSSAGDVNGDGFDDLMVGANLDDPNGNASGASFVVFGSRTDITGGDGAFELADIETGNGSLGFVLRGVSAGDTSGRSVSSAGDVNGDGFDDLFVGAPNDDPNGSGSGASFVVFGSAADITGGDGAFELSDIETGDGSLGFVLNGGAANEQTGRSVSSAGDVNGDGFDDLIVGAYLAGGTGASFVVFGSGTDITGGDGAFELSDIGTGDGSSGFVLNGVSAFDFSGLSVSTAGDVNGDGFDDLFVGALYDDPNGDSSGASFVVFGADFLNIVDAAGTAGADVLIGGAGDDTLSGGGGGDLLKGAAGGDNLTGGLDDDQIEAGSGNDMINHTVGDGVDMVDGGSGDDTVVIDGITGTPSTLLIEDGAANAARLGLASGDPGFVKPSHLAISVNGAVAIDANDVEKVVFNAGDAGDTVTVSGDFTVTDLDPETIEFNGGLGDDNVDASGLTSDHRLVVNGAGGDDSLIGGDGDDLFIFENGTGNDMIQDFIPGTVTPNVDEIDISDFGFVDLNAVLAAATDQGDDVLIQLDVDDSVTLLGVNKADLAAAIGSRTTSASTLGICPRTSSYSAARYGITSPVWAKAHRRPLLRPPSSPARTSLSWDFQRPMKPKLAMAARRYPEVSVNGSP